MMGSHTSLSELSFAVSSEARKGGSAVGTSPSSLPVISARYVLADSASAPTLALSEASMCAYCSSAETASAAYMSMADCREEITSARRFALAREDGTACVHHFLELRLVRRLVRVG